MFTFTRGKVRSLRQFWFTGGGVVVPPPHSQYGVFYFYGSATGGVTSGGGGALIAQTFTKLCCIVCQQYFASKALQRLSYYIALRDVKKETEIVEAILLSFFSP